MGLILPTYEERREIEKESCIGQKSVNAVQEEYRQEIEQMIQSSYDTEYLRAVYTFARHFPNKSVVAYN